MKGAFGLQVGHDHKETFTRVFVCLELVVYGGHASPSAQENQKLRRKVGVIARLRNVDLGTGSTRRKNAKPDCLSYINT